MGENLVSFMCRVFILIFSCVCVCIYILSARVWSLHCVGLSRAARRFNGGRMRTCAGGGGDPFPRGVHHKIGKTHTILVSCITLTTSFCSRPPNMPCSHPFPAHSDRLWEGERERERVWSARRDQLLQLRSPRRGQRSQSSRIAGAGDCNLCSPRRWRDNPEVPMAADECPRPPEPPSFVLLRQEPIEPLARQRHTPRRKLQVTKIG